MRLKIPHVLGMTGTIVLLFLATAFYMPAGGNVARIHMLGLDKDAVPKRIVSMAPSITETLFAIGMGESVKGVTDFCDYPEEAKKLPKVGGYYDPNYEVILALHPDLVILLPENKEQRLRFQHLRIPTMTVHMDTIAGIITTFIQLGTAFRKEAQAYYLVEQFQDRMLASHEARTVSKPKRVMLVIGRDYAEKPIREVYIAGKDGFYSELLKAVGAVNAYPHAVPKYPKLSLEGILSLSPDVIIELIAEPEKISRPIESLKQDWTSLPGLVPAGTQQVYIITGTYVVRPGPRLLQLLTEFAQCLHVKER